MQNRDVIELADYGLQYGADTAVSQGRPNPASASMKPRSVCAIRILTGTNAGQEIDLVKPVTTLGQPGLQIATIAGHAHGYCLSHMEGEIYPVINGNSIGIEACFMSHRNVIDQAGTQMKFLAC